MKRTDSKKTERAAARSKKAKREQVKELDRDLLAQVSGGSSIEQVKELAGSSWY